MSLPCPVKTPETRELGYQWSWDIIHLAFVGDIWNDIVCLLGDSVLIAQIRSMSEMCGLTASVMALRHTAYTAAREATLHTSGVKIGCVVMIVGLVSRHFQ